MFDWKKRRKGDINLTPLTVGVRCLVWSSRRTLFKRLLFTILLLPAVNVLAPFLHPLFSFYLLLLFTPSALLTSPLPGLYYNLKIAPNYNYGTGVGWLAVVGWRICTFREIVITCLCLDINTCTT